MMPILRKAQHAGGYTIVDNEPVRDGGLSLKALGLLVVMLHLPEKWQFSESGLRQFFSDGRDSMRTALKELEDARYVVRSQPRGDDNLFDSWVWYVSETPIPSSAPLSVFPTADFPKAGFPNSENPTLLIKEEPTTDLPSTEKDMSGKPDPAPIVREVIDYLNEKTGKHFKASTKATARHISARVRDGYALDDFKRVIDTKAAQWGRDSKMSAYLRPETLFGPKFEGYLNETPAKGARGHDNSAYNA